MNTIIRKPDWLKSNKLGAGKAAEIRKKLKKLGLHTVCDSARCPNRGECFERKTATFMILGETCTRNCTFCAVDKTKKLLPPDETEPQKIADLALELGLKHVVITTVTRDDLPDGGASHFVKVIKAIKATCGNNVTVEVLTSDLKGNKADIELIVNAKPDVFNHNIETIQKFYAKARAMADYKRSLDFLAYVKQLDENMLTKSGFMVGLGETIDEVKQLLQDLKKANVDIVTIGQYMAPTGKHLELKEYIKPEVFKLYEDYAYEIGFALVESGPLVRSSYKAEKARDLIKKHKKQ